MPFSDTSLAAVGTAGALIATVVIFWTDYARRIRLSRSHQASLIAAWTLGAETGDHHRVVVLSNRSDAPAYRVNVFVEGTSDDSGVNTFHQTLLPPGDTERQVARHDPESPGPRMRPLVRIVFTDQYGRSVGEDS